MKVWAEQSARIFYMEGQEVAKRDTYNIKLINGVDYKYAGGIKKLFSIWSSLERLAGQGDQVALSILIDLKTVLGYYPSTPTTLTPEEIDLIRKVLIYGYSQDEIGKSLGVSQKTVSVRLAGSIRKIIELLNEEGEE